MSEVLKHKLNYSAAFIRSAIGIFKEELSVDLKKGSTNIKQSTSPSFENSIVIGFTSKFFIGQVIYSMHKEVGEAFARKMLPDMLPHQQRELIPSILGEVANMVSGRASIELAGNDDKIQITPPIFIESKCVTFNFLKTPTNVIILYSQIGSLEINLGFKIATP